MHGMQLEQIRPQTQNQLKSAARQLRPVGSRLCMAKQWNKSARGYTAALYADAATAPGVGGLVLSLPLSEYTLPPEVVLYQPSAGDIHRGGAPAPQGKTGNRLIFLNVPLLDSEQRALKALHDALKGEKALAPAGALPSYVRLHALRILQQARWRVDRALTTIATHLEMRVQKMPVHEDSVLQDLQSGMMYWHGRDRACRPVLVWRAEKICGLDPERATKMMLFVLEYAVRYLMVPGRVENWVLIVDLTNCGMSMGASSSTRSITRNVTRLLEEVYCGRNFTTKIFHMPFILRAIVNSLIPEDKKSKVEFVADSDIASCMRKLCEAHQLEEQYGGTAPNVRAGEAYPFRFFPHCRGPASGGTPPLPSLHDTTDRLFHEGLSLDTNEQAVWEEFIGAQALTEQTAEAMSKHLGRALEPTVTFQQWQRLISPEASQKFTGTALEAPASSPDLVNSTDAAEAINSAAGEKEDPVKDAANEDDSKPQITTVVNTKMVPPAIEGESSAVCCYCSP